LPDVFARIVGGPILHRATSNIMLQSSAATITAMYNARRLNADNYSNSNFFWSC